MIFEWDEGKAVSNLGKHGISFEDAKMIFDDPATIIDTGTTTDYGEQRFKAFGYPGVTSIIVVFTMRASSVRIISATRSHRSERRRYAGQGNSK